MIIMKKIDLIIGAATAIKWRIEELYSSGESLDAARVSALKQFSFYGVYSPLRGDIIALVNSLNIFDISKQSISNHNQYIYEKLLLDTGFKDTWTRRLLWNWFGVFTE